MFEHAYLDTWYKVSFKGVPFHFDVAVTLTEHLPDKSYYNDLVACFRQCKKINDVTTDSDNLENFINFPIVYILRKRDTKEVVGYTHHFYVSQYKSIDAKTYIHPFKVSYEDMFEMTSVSEAFSSYCWYYYDKYDIQYTSYEIADPTFIKSVNDSLPLSHGKEITSFNVRPYYNFMYWKGKPSRSALNYIVERGYSFKPFLKQYPNQLKLKKLVGMYNSKAPIYGDEPNLHSYLSPYPYSLFKTYYKSSLCPVISKENDIICCSDYDSFHKEIILKFYYIDETVSIRGVKSFSDTVSQMIISLISYCKQKQIPLKYIEFDIKDKLVGIPSLKEYEMPNSIYKYFMEVSLGQ